MPWKECHVMDERLRFVARLLDGEKMTALCAEFEISRKTGYKIFERYKDYGVHGLTDRSRRPYRHANQLPLVIETQIVRLKKDYPDWGAPKIREKLRGRCGPLRCPAISTVHAVLDRHGLVQRRKRRRHRAIGTALTGQHAQLPLVRGFQGPVSPRQPAVLLSVDDHGLCHPLPAHLRSVVQHRGGVCVCRLRTHIQGLWAAARHSHRQRGALCVRSRALWLEQAVGLVAPARRRDRTHPAGPPRAERAA
jgi:hypothetical protein